MCITSIMSFFLLMNVAGCISFLKVLSIAVNTLQTLSPLHILRMHILWYPGLCRGPVSVWPVCLPSYRQYSFERPFAHFSDWGAQRLLPWSSLDCKQQALASIALIIPHYWPFDHILPIGSIIGLYLVLINLILSFLPPSIYPSFLLPYSINCINFTL